VENDTLTQSDARRHLLPIAIVLVALVALWLAILAALGGGGLDQKETKAMDEPVSLEAGQPLERRIEGGGKHQYLLRVEAGEYVRVAAEQRGIDVVLRLFGPDGALLTEVDSPTGDRGAERVSEVAPAAGAYRLEVEAFEAAVPGDYEVRIEERRAATEVDRRRVEAERVFAEGEGLRRARDWEAALERYGKAVEILDAAGDRAARRHALYGAGRVLESLDRWPEAVRSYDLAVEASRAAGDRAVEAVVLNRRGTLQRLLGRYEASRLSHEQALEAFRANEHPSGEKSALNNLGVADYWAGRVQAAVAAFDGALGLARELGDRRDEGAILANLGEIYLFQGRHAEARDAYEKALAVARELGDTAREAAALSGLGEVESQEGRFSPARDALERAAKLQREQENRRGEALALNSLGTVLLKSGELQASRERYSRALEIFRELGDVQGEATVLVGLGRLEEARGDFPASFTRYGEARERFERLRDRQGLAMARFGGARSLARQGDLQGARELLEASLGAVESLRGEAQSLSLRASYFATKQHYWEQYIDVLMGLHQRDPSGGFDALALQAAERRRFRSLLDALSETRAEVRRGISPALLEEERALQQRLDRIERDRLETLAAGGDRERVETLERETRELLQSLERVRARVRQESPRFADLVQPETVSLQQIQGKLLDADDLLLVYSLGEERSFVWAVTRQSFTVRELPGRERIDSAAERVYGLMTRQSRRGRSLWEEAPADLAELVLAPVADRTRSFTRLLVVADGVLQKVPFAALPLPGGEGRNLVVDRHEIVMLPSASVLATLRREAEGRSTWIDEPWVAVLADPVFDRQDPRVTGQAAAAGPNGASALDSGLRASLRDLGLPGLQRLPHSRREAEAIRRWTRQERDRFVALDFAADRELVTGGRLRDYRILHFATHSIVNDRQPELSGLVLSLVGPDGRPRQGFLRLHEIYNLELNAGLVVLSACQTGVGPEVRGEGLAGIVRGFMHAGVPGVVVSLWNVDDAATAELMSRFYGYLLEHGQRPSTALRRAQLDLLKTTEWRDPEFWAGFVFVGDPSIRLGGGIEAEDTGGVQPAQKAGNDLPPPKIAPDDDEPSPPRPLRPVDGGPEGLR
jgi:CHAT domain-containing protein/tetratricopeptide (TPR) repeat protein